MLNITDYILCGILFYLFIRGWTKGLLKTLLGPISLIIAGFMAFTYYQRTQNITISLLIGIIGPFVIKFLTSCLLTLWHRAVKKNEPIPSPSRLLGSTLSILWGAGYLILLLIFIAVAPIRAGWFKTIQKNVTASKSYSFIDHWLGKKIPSASLDIGKIVSVFEDPSRLEKFESTQEFQALMDNKHLKELFSDEETAEQLRTKNFSQLLSNPKMQDVLKDKELLKNMLELNKRIMEEK